MASFDIQIRYDDPNEIRALYQSLLRAGGAERTELNRLRLVAHVTGYLAQDEGAVHSANEESARIETRLYALDIVATAVRGQMRKHGIEPW